MGMLLPTEITTPRQTFRRKTAARDLDDLVEKGVLERLGEKRGIYYVLVGKK